MRLNRVALGGLASVAVAVASLAMLRSAGRPATPSVRVSAASARSLPGAVGAGELQSAPTYREAVGCFRKHRYRQALQLIESLSNRCTDADQRAFLDRQRSICLRAAGLPIAAAQTASTPAVPALDRSDCGPRALAIVCSRLGRPVDIAFLSRTAHTNAHGTTMAGLIRAAKAVGLKAEGVQASREGLDEIELPAVAWVNGNHFIAVLERRGSGEDATFTVHDPNDAEEKALPRDQLLSLSNGYMLLVGR